MGKVVIIDSGINLNHPIFRDSNINGIHFYKDDENRIISDDNINDEYGHGTAVAAILRKCSSDTDIYIIKIFDKEAEIDEELFLHSLEYVYEKIKCDIINMSFGLTQYISLENMEEMCQKLYNNGVMLVSAFDNYGAVSFPAAFPSVIGVDSSIAVKKIDEFEFVEDSYVDIIAKGGLQRLAWSKPNYIFSQGNSFAAPYITSFLANTMGKNKITSKNAKSFLRERATKVYYGKRKESIGDKPSFHMPSKAILFPYNKEMHSLVRYNNDLAFSFDIYDIRISGHIGENTGKSIENSDFIIRDINCLDWNSDFDTVILGHTEELSIITKYKLSEFIIEKCVEYGKNIISFDELSAYREKIKLLEQRGYHVYYPQIDQNDVPVNSFDKLYYIPNPTVAICGTSSAQGKFTLQMRMREYFINKGYKVGQIGTEPSALLYGMDEVCPIGYASNVKLSDYKFISAVNKLVYKVSQKSPDIIFTGTQSGMIPYRLDSLRNIPLYSMLYLFGVNPDAIILCVNVHDDKEYLQRTICTIENLYNTKVLALVLFPKTFKNDWSGNIGSKRIITEEEKEKFIENAKLMLNKEVFYLPDHEGLGILCDRIIQYFGEEE